MSALDNSVTLEDVFAVVGTRRVPLAPELAGYLVLEIAEHADPMGGDVDPRSVFVGDEGTVALVKPKRDSIVGDAEISVRAALARLLEASGSQTPALAAASKRKGGGGLHQLAEELEAALIPVNRAAGRRALARLAREVKRVTLGVGRNAPPAGASEVPTRRAPSSPSYQAPMPSTVPAPTAPSPETPPPPSVRPPPVSVRPPPASVRPPPVQAQPPSEPTVPAQLPSPIPRPPEALTRTARSPSSATFTKEEEPTTARGQIPEEVLKKATPEPLPVQPPPAPSPGLGPLGRPRTDKEIEASELPTMEFVPPGRGPSPSQADVDSLIADFGVSGGSEREQRGALKQIAGLEPTPPPPRAGELSPEMMKRLETREVLPQGSRQAPGHIRTQLGIGVERGQPPSSRDSGISGLLAASAEPDAEAEARRLANLPPPTNPEALPPQRPPSPSMTERQLPTQPSKLKQMRASLPSIPQPSRKRAGLGPFIALLVIAGGVYALWLMRATLFGSRPPAPTAATSSSGAPQAPPPCNQVLIVTDVPPHAEVLLRKGQAPVDVERMPVGTRLEFVATAEGFAPKRVVVPLGATWDPGADGKPRYEAGVQLDKSKAAHGTNDPWPAGEPGSAVGGQGPPGTVHVVATPRGAEVWMLAGLGPEARIEQQLACDEDVDVLVAGPTTFRKRLHVAASDFVPEDTPPKPGAKAEPRKVARISGK